MERIVGIIERGEWDPAKAVDTVSLDANDRHRRRIVLKTENGIELLLDLPQPLALRDGDGLVLEDRSIVGVTGMPEPVLDIEAANSIELTRLAWHLGNRHTDVQILDGGALRIRADHVLADMLRGLGARVTPREAPFEPEAGAYDHAGHAPAHHTHVHRHDHDHSHDDHHHHHDHTHPHARGKP